MKLKEIIINDYLVYKNKTVLPLKPKSITVIRGKNLDRTDKNSSNGSGKSLIVNTLPSIKFNSAPLPMKVKKNPREGFTKDTYQILNIDDDKGNNYSIKKYFKGTTRLQITKNGRDLAIKDSSLKESSEASTTLDKILPINEEQFYTLYYFDIKRPSVFQYGTDAQRHGFVEKLFKLDIYDRIAADVKKDWDASKLIIQEIEILDEQLSDKSGNLKQDPKELRAQHKKLLEKTEKLRTKVGQLIKDKDQCKTFIILSNDIKEPSLARVIKKLSHYKAQLKTARQNYVDAVANNKGIEENKEIAETKSRLLGQLEKLKNIKVDASLQKDLANDKNLLNEIEETAEKNREIERAREELKSEIKALASEIENVDTKIKKNSDKFTKTKIDKNLLREKIVLRDLETNLNDTLEHLKSHGEQNCPVCSTLLDEKTLKELVKTKRGNIEKSKTKLSILDQMAFYKKLREKEEVLSEKLKALTKELKPSDHSVADIEKRIEEKEELLQKMRSKVILKGKISELPEIENRQPIAVEPISKDIESFEVKVNYYTDQKNKLEQLAKLDLPFDSLSQAKSKQSEVDSLLYQYQPFLDKLQQRLSTVSVDAVQAETLTKDIKDLSQKIDQLKLSAPNFKIQTVLRKAFGPRGIRKQRVAEIGAALETTLNKYAEQVFDFPINFEMVITDTKFQILAHRNNNVADVRTLSGAESRYFSLLLMMTLLKYTPSNMRLDTVFLDEAEASLDKAFRDRYISVYVPLLQELVSKVVIITPLPDTELFIPKCIEYTVTKHKNVSTLTKTR